VLEDSETFGTTPEESATADEKVPERVEACC